MAWFDMPLDKLRRYRPPVTEPRDFDTFWKRTLNATAEFPLDARFEPVTHAYFKSVDVFDVTFNGFGGQAVKAWFIRPAAANGKHEPRPCIVTYVGYGGGRGLPIEHVAPSIAGFAHLIMDTRGQGSGWSPGQTHDDAPAGSDGPQVPGVMTRGIASPETYYYRRLFTDAVRAVEVVANRPDVDPRRIAVTGGSQGGGITLAVAGLLGRRVKLAMPDVPFLCHYRRATQIVDSSPYSEIQAYLKCHRGQDEQVFATLAYFDGIHFARRIKARSLVSVALMDVTCPPSTVFAAYNRITAPKDIEVYTYNNHEGGGPFQHHRRMLYATEHL